MRCQTEIDFVVTWVDGADPAWRREKDAYGSNSDGDDRPGADRPLEDIGDVRYRDNGLLRYWFRGVEKFAPWVRRIHFVTWGHIPPWLNVDDKKLNIVRHEDFIPEEFLPTFNSNAIELNLHRIEGLSEHFVYFNDDVFPIRNMKESDFFRDGKPCDMLAFQPVVANPENPVMSHTFLNNSLVISKHFDKRENVKKQPGKYFKVGYPPLYFFYNLLELAFPKYTGFYTVHGPAPLCRQTYRDVWEMEPQKLKETSLHKFRCEDDVSIYLIRDWQKLTGNFRPRNLLSDFAFFSLGNDNIKLYKTVTGRKKKVVCINDADEKYDFENVKRELTEVFEKILPERSAFEKP